MKSDKKNQPNERIEMGNRIRDARRKKGLTIEQMSERMEMSEPGYRKIESGAGGMSEKTLRKLQAALGVSFDYILRGNRTDKEALVEEVHASLPGTKMEILIRILVNLMNAEDIQLNVDDKDLLAIFEKGMTINDRKD